MSRMDEEQQQALLIMAIIITLIFAAIFLPKIIEKINISAPVKVCTQSATWWGDGSGPIGSDYDTGAVDIQEARKIAGGDKIFKKEICTYQ